MKSKCKVESSKRKVKSKTQNPNFKLQNYFAPCSLLLVLLFLFSCSTTYSLYSKNIFYGKSALELGKYEDAKQYFNEASKAIRDSKSLAYLAIAYYKTGKIDSAEKFIKEAERIDNGTFDYLRVIGYKAIILLKKGSDEGSDALRDYIETYKCLEPLPSLDNIETMLKKKEIRIDELEKLIDEQLTTYDNDLDQYLTTGTGFLSNKYPRGGDLM